MEKTQLGVPMSTTSVHKMTSAHDAARCVNAIMSREKDCAALSPFSEETIRKYVARALISDSYVIFVGKVNDTPIVFVGGWIGERHYSDQPWTTIEMIVSPDPNPYPHEFAELFGECLDAFSDWTKQCNARGPVVGWDSGHSKGDVIGRILVRRGYIKTGEIFAARKSEDAA